MIPGGGDLRFDRMPPRWVPLRAFLAAPVLGGFGGLMLGIVGGSAAESRYVGELIGALHLVTLGFLTLVMVGAVVQVLPVVTGVPVPGASWVGPASQLGVAGGSLAMAGGLAGRWGPVIGAGGILVGAGLTVFAAAGIVAAWQARRNPTGRAMGLAVVSLVVVATLGVAFLAGHAGWTTLRRDLTDVHLAWALIGWLGLLVMGVSFQVVPMFQVTPQYPQRVQHWIPAAGFLGLVVWTFGRVGRWSPVAAVGAVVAVGAVAIHAGVTLWLQAHRRRKLRDVTTDDWRLGMASVIVAALLVGAAGVGLVDLGRTGPALALGVLVVFGAGVSVVEGMLYKIVPFLSWLHLQNLVSRREAGAAMRIRNMRQLLPASGPRRQFVAHLVAVVTSLVAAVAGGVWVRIAGFALAVDLWWLAWELAGVVRRSNQDRREVLGAS